MAGFLANTSQASSIIFCHLSSLSVSFNSSSNNLILPEKKYHLSWTSITMAISSFIFKPHLSFFSAKPYQNPENRNYTRPSPSFLTLHSSNKNGSSTTINSLSSSHKLSWEQELKQAFHLQNSEVDDSDEVFQSLIDKRCVDNVRMLIVDAVQNAKAGHPGMALGMAGIGYHLYRHVMKYDPKDPKWFNRDRFVLSAGHGCLLQYVCLHLAGFDSVQVYTSPLPTFHLL